MARIRSTTEVNRAELARISLEEVRLWPGCEGIISVGVLQSGSERFVLRIAEYGAVPKKLADRAIRVIERDKLRRYHLKCE
jgi:hypothetical protein